MSRPRAQIELWASWVGEGWLRLKKALLRFLPIDNNQVENQIRPWAIGRSNWLYAGSLRSGKRTAAIMSFIHSCAYECA